MSIEVMKQALEALDKMYSAAPDIAEPAIQALRTAIEQAEKQEPLAYITPLMEQQIFDDWCPYKGSPDPRTVWAAAVEAVNGLLLGAIPPAAPVQEAVAWGVHDQIALNKAIANHSIPAAPVQEPVAWKHDCAALLQNDVELWVDRCPHCGKPRATSPAAPVQEPSASRQFHEWAVAEHAKLNTTPPAAQLEECVVCGDKVRVIPRPWVGLTDEEIMELLAPLYSDPSLVPWAIEVSMDEYRAIEAKLREKNGGQA